LYVFGGIIAYRNKYDAGKRVHLSGVQYACSSPVALVSTETTLMPQHAKGEGGVEGDLLPQVLLRSNGRDHAKAIETGS
jgi:hypothetical protein